MFIKQVCHHSDVAALAARLAPSAPRSGPGSGDGRGAVPWADRCLAPFSSLRGRRRLSAAAAGRDRSRPGMAPHLGRRAEDRVCRPGPHIHQRRAQVAQLGQRSEPGLRPGWCGEVGDPQRAGPGLGERPG